MKQEWQDHQNRAKRKPTNGIRLLHILSLSVWSMEWTAHMIRSHENRRWCAQCAIKRFAIRLHSAACLSKATLSCKTWSVYLALILARLIEFQLPPFWAIRYKIGNLVGVHNRPNDKQLLTSNKNANWPSEAPICKPRLQTPPLFLSWVNTFAAAGLLLPVKPKRRLG